MSLHGEQESAFDLRSTMLHKYVSRLLRRADAPHFYELAFMVEFSVNSPIWA
jgi:hypothetical protein